MDEKVKMAHTFLHGIVEGALRKGDHGLRLCADNAIEALVDLQASLEESVKLQSHYAALLNDYDGGERRQFATADEWLARLREPHQR
jgi:hypothetical protein